MYNSLEVFKHNFEFPNVIITTFAHNTFVLKVIAIFISSFQIPFSRFGHVEGQQHIRKGQRSTLLHINFSQNIGESRVKNDSIR